MYANDDSTSRARNEQDLPSEVMARIHEASGNPKMLTNLLIEFCPGLTPAVALAWIKEDLAFEQEAMNQAAILMGGKWQ